MDSGKGGAYIHEYHSSTMLLLKTANSAKKGLQIFAILRKNISIKDKGKYAYQCKEVCMTIFQAGAVC